MGAGGETRTHGGFPVDYKSTAIATMRLQHDINLVVEVFHDDQYFGA